MNADETIALLDKTVNNHAAIDAVPDWLAQEGIHTPAFVGYMHRLVAAAATSDLKPKPSPFFFISLGFGLGWEAHKVMLATPIEARPPPDLSESLE